MDHDAEFRRCLLELDVAGIRALWQHLSPGLPQPQSQDETLHTMHMARMAMTTLPEPQRAYSEAWLKERQTGRVVSAVGIAIGMHGELDPERRVRAFELRSAMSDAVTQAVQDGVDLASETPEVQRRMALARQRVTTRIYASGPWSAPAAEPTDVVVPVADPMPSAEPAAAAVLTPMPEASPSPAVEPSLATVDRPTPGADA